ncbi:MAG: pilus assembly protein [Lachnospiraceae bacterium]|nr:pilus assembly protein [Lachnospiraceae bacterium]
MMRCFKDNKGSFTIEAAVIIPFIVCLLMTILFLAFFLYDRCSLERAAGSAALRGSREIWESSDVQYQKANEGIDFVLSHNLLGADYVDKQIKISGNEIEVILRMQYHKWEFQAESQKKVVNPVNFIRICRKGKGVIKSIQ